MNGIYLTVFYIKELKQVWVLCMSMGIGIELKSYNFMINGKEKKVLRIRTNRFKKTKKELAHDKKDGKK